MAYHTMLFLLVFLPLILICYQIAGTKYRPYVLLAAGYIFFASFRFAILSDIANVFQNIYELYPGSIYCDTFDVLRV